MSDRVANHSLQSSTYWLRGHRFESMDGAHLQNCLRMITRNPLAQFKQSHDAWLWECASVPDGMGGDDRLPDGGDEIFEELVDRWQWNEARSIIELDQLDDIAGVDPTWFRTRGAALDWISTHLEPATFEQLNERAAEWIRKTPTYQAMSEALLHKIIAGDCSIERTPDPLAPEPF